MLWSVVSSFRDFMNHPFVMCVVPCSVLAETFGCVFPDFDSKVSQIFAGAIRNYRR